MAIGQGLPDVRDPGVSSIPDVTAGAGRAQEAQASMWSRFADASAQLRQRLAPALERAGRTAGGKAALEGQFHPSRTLFPDEYDEGFRIANEAGFLAQESAKIDTALAELYAKSPLDQDGFRRAAVRARSDALRQAPLPYVAQLGMAWAERTADYQRSISVDRAQRDVAASRERIEGALQAAKDRVLALADEGVAPDSARGIQAIADYEALNATLANDPLFMTDPAEAEADFFITAERATVRSQLRTMLAENDLRAASAYVEALGEAELSPHSKADADEMLRDFVAGTGPFAAFAASADRAAQQEIADALFLNGDPDAAEAKLRASRASLDGDTYRTIASAINSFRNSPDNQGDVVTALELERDILSGSLDREEAMSVVIGLAAEGRLTQAQSNRLMTMAQSGQDDRTRESESLMRGLFGEGLMDFNQDLSAQMQGALGELRTARAANPQMTREEERALVYEVAAAYRRNIFNTLPPLRGSSGFAQVRPQSRQALEAAKAGLTQLAQTLAADADPGNDLTPAEVAAEFALYERYEAMIDIWERTQ